MERKKFKSALTHTCVLIIIAAIVSEAVGMLILHHTKTAHNNLVLFDSFLLPILLIPALYLFVYKPFDAHLKEISLLNREKNEIIKELNIALNEIKTLSGILPICSSCKNIRDDEGYWNQIESYIKEHSDADFTHGLCPKCAKKLYPELIDKNGNIGGVKV